MNSDALLRFMQNKDDEADLQNLQVVPRNFKSSINVKHCTVQLIPFILFSYEILLLFHDLIHIIES